MLWLKFTLGVDKKSRVVGHMVMYGNEFKKKKWKIKFKPRIKLNHNVDKLTMYIYVYLIMLNTGSFFTFSRAWHR